jgi:hypothetical protein
MEIEHAVLEFACALVLASSTLGSAAQGVQSQPGAKPGSAQSPEPTAPSLPPLTPPKAPKITCSGDRLSISADDSTLQSVLAAVRECIGVKIELPDGAAESRTFEELGPGPARQVLETLLSGTEFDFLIESTVADPQKIDAVLLSLRGKEAVSAAAGSRDPAARPKVQTREVNKQGTRPSDAGRMLTAVPSDSSVTDEPVGAAGESAGTDASQIQPSNAASAEAAPATPDNPAASASDAAQNASPAKALDDKISNMQQLFEQRRQITESQNSAPK